MDSSDNCLTLLFSEIVEQLTDGASLEGVEAGGGLVQHDKGGIGNEFHAHGYTLALTTGEYLSVNATDLGVLHVVETEFSDDLDDEFVLNIVSCGKSKTGRKGESLLGCEVREQNIVLHDVRGVTGIGVLVDWHNIVEHNFTLELGLVDEGDTIRENVKERSFTSTGGTHDVGSDTGSCVA